jgi:hypothetical protein
VWLFEETWADVGEPLPWIKKPADVLDAIRVWDNPNSSTGTHYIAKNLLRPTSTPATPKWLSETRRQLGKLNEAVRNADETRRKLKESTRCAIDNDRAVRRTASPAVLPLPNSPPLERAAWRNPKRRRFSFLVS